MRQYIISVISVFPDLYNQSLPSARGIKTSDIIARVLFRVTQQANRKI